MEMKVIKEQGKYYRLTPQGIERLVRIAPDKWEFIHLWEQVFANIRSPKEKELIILLLSLNGISADTVIQYIENLPKK